MSLCRLQASCAHSCLAPAVPGAALRLPCRPVVLQMPAPIFSSTTNEHLGLHLRKYGYALLSAREPFDKMHQVATQRRFALQECTKRALTHGVDDGYAASPHKEMFHFQQQSPGLVRNSSTALYRSTMIRLGCGVMKAVTNHLAPEGKLNIHLAARAGSLEPDALQFLTDWQNQFEYYMSQANYELLQPSLVTDFKYLASNPSELHCEEHIDKGLLTIISNPVGVEVKVNGVWTQVSWDGMPADVKLILTGYTLERATAGVMCAAVHRVRNTGLRLSTVTKLRLALDFHVQPAVLTKYVPEDLVLGMPESFCIGDIERQFNSTHSSVNKPCVSLALPFLKLPELQYGGTSWLLLLPTTLISWIIQLLVARDLARLFAASSCLQLWNTRQDVWVSAAERSAIDWNLALDGAIDTESPSPLRCTYQNTAINAPNFKAFRCKPDFAQATHVLTSVRSWAKLICSRIISANSINIAIKGPDGSSVFFKIRPTFLLKKLVYAYCQQAGTGSDAIHFLYAGERIALGDHVCELDLIDGDVIDGMLMQVGD